MLNVMRNASNNIIIKILLSLVAVALVWTMGDFLKRSTNNNIATIGRNIKITREEFLMAKKSEFSRLQNLFGELNIEQFENLNLDGIILQRLINNRLIEAETVSLDLLVSDFTAAQELKLDPIFFGETKKFDKDKFNHVLSINNLTEDKYLDLIKKNIASKYLMSAIDEQSISYSSLVKPIATYNNQEFIVDVVKVDSKYVANASVTKDEINKYYEQNKINFTLPEKRQISYLLINANNFTGKIEVTNYEIENEYNQNKANYMSEELREIYDIEFLNKNDADKFHENITKSNFHKDKKYSNSLKKNLKKSDLASEFQEIVFSLKPNEYSQVIKTDFGYHILFVNDIKPSKILSFIDARSQIQKELKNRKSEDSFIESIKIIEDELAGGSVVEEVAKKYNLQIEKSGLLNQENFIHNEKFKNFKDAANLFFANDASYTSNLIADDNDKNYLIFHIDEIAQEQVAELSKVEPEIKFVLEKQKKEESISNMLKEFKEKQNVKDPKLIITRKNVKYSDYVNLKASFSDEYIKDIFSRQKNEYTEIYNISNEQSFSVIKDVIKNDKIDSTQIKKVEDDLKNEIVSNINDEYIIYLNKKHKVKIYD